MSKKYSIDIDFELPVAREPGPPSPEMSMDAYVRFIEYSRKHVVSAKDREDALARVPAPVTFVIDD